MEHGLVAQTTHRAMGTVMAHRAFGLRAEDSLEAVRREVARIEGLLSRFLPAIELKSTVRPPVSLSMSLILTS